MLEVNSAIAVEKEIAADTLGTIFAATRNHFLPYVEQSTLELVQLLPHYYEGIRKSATDSLLEIIRTFYELSDHQGWQPSATVVSILSLKLVSIMTVSPFIIASSAAINCERAHLSHIACAIGALRV